MKILKAVALLLHYPDGVLVEHADELVELVREEERLSSPVRQGLVDFITARRKKDLLELQADYVAQFDRSRSLSLHLFEHVHGESRDRGQAMVKLLSVYREHGFDISANELPDYVPLFLEFCSQLPGEQAQKWLHEIEHLLQLLHGRLEERKSPYAILFRALLELGGLETADDSLRHQIRTEKPDDTPQALDRVWAEEPVVFGPTSGCGGARTNSGQAVPIDTSGLNRHRTGVN